MSAVVINIADRGRPPADVTERSNADSEFVKDARRLEYLMPKGHTVVHRIVQDLLAELESEE